MFLILFLYPGSLSQIFISPLNMRSVSRSTLTLDPTALDQYIGTSTTFRLFAYALVITSTSKTKFVNNRNRIDQYVESKTVRAYVMQCLNSIIRSHYAGCEFVLVEIFSHFTHAKLNVCQKGKGNLSKR